MLRRFYAVCFCCPCTNQRWDSSPAAQALNDVQGGELRRGAVCNVDAEAQSLRHSKAEGRGIPYGGRSNQIVDAREPRPPPSSSRSGDPPVRGSAVRHPLPLINGDILLYTRMVIAASSRPLTKVKGRLKIVRHSRRLSTLGRMALYMPIMASSGSP